MLAVAWVVLYRQPSLLRGGDLSKGIAPKNTHLLYPDVECLLRSELCKLLHGLLEGIVLAIWDRDMYSAFPPLKTYYCG